MKMKSLRLFLLAFAATITIGAFAQDSVIPSRLRVQSIGVGITAPTTNGDARANRIGVGTAATGAAGTITATLFSGAASGDGSALTNLNATNVATGTLNNARLPAAISVTSVAATTVTANGNNVCQSTGTNCPSGAPVDLVCNAGGTCNPGVVAVGQSLRIVKPFTTSRNTTVALAADPDLAWSVTTGGTYLMTWCMNYSGTATGTQGIKFAFNRTTVGSNSFHWTGSNNATGTSTFFGANVASSPGGTLSQWTVATISVASSSDSACGTGVLISSGSVTYAVEWAQNSSNANNTNLLGNSGATFMIFKRIN